jgi:hypothetical protein
MIFESSILRVSFVALAFAFPGRVLADMIEIQTEELPRAIVGMDYEATIATRVDGLCPIGNVGLFLAFGKLPRGLQVSNIGLTGVPKEMGIFHFSLGARNTCAAATPKEFELLVTGRPILRAYPGKIELTITEGAPSRIQTVLISSTWPGLPYKISAVDGAWIGFRQTQGATPEEGSAFTGDRLSVQAIPSKLKPGVHHGQLMVSAWRAEPIQIDIVVTVLEKAPDAAP